MLTVATDYFGLVQDNRLKVVIDDGIKFLKKSVKNGNEKNIKVIDLTKSQKIFLDSNLFLHQDNHSKRSFSMWIVKTVQLA